MKPGIGHMTILACAQHKGLYLPVPAGIMVVQPGGAVCGGITFTSESERVELAQNLRQLATQAHLRVDMIQQVDLSEGQPMMDQVSHAYESCRRFQAMHGQTTASHPDDVDADGNPTQSARILYIWATLGDYVDDLRLLVPTQAGNGTPGDIAANVSAEVYRAKKTSELCFTALPAFVQFVMRLSQE